MLVHNLKIPPPMSRLDFLIPTFSRPLFTVLACGFPILHHSVVDQVICLEDQNLPRLAKHFPSMKAPAKFLSFLEGTHQSGKYLLWVEQMSGSICKLLMMWVFKFREISMWSIRIYLWFDGAIAEAWITWEIVLFKCFLNP